MKGAKNPEYARPPGISAHLFFFRFLFIELYIITSCGRAIFV